jgi:DNA-binding NarL/FixJ family response regulator
VIVVGPAEADRAAAQAAGADGFLLVPFERARLIEAVRKLLTGRTSEG